MKAACTILIASLFALPSAAANDPLAALDFLLGQWSGGAPGMAGMDVFQRELNGHVLQRRSQGVIAASAGKSQSSMMAQLTIYATGADAALAAIYFDNEGHVIHYDHVTVTAQRAEFLSDGQGTNPAFRLIYSLKAPGVLHVTFEMQPPGQSTYRLIAEADETATH